MNILPFSDKPLVICYQNLAFPLGIIEANAKLRNEDVTPWVVSTYLNPFFSPTASNHYDICVFDNWGTHESILLHQYIHFFKRTYQYLGVNIVRDLCMMINEGCYISGIYNEKYIPEKKAYNRRDFNHDYILYGVDETRKVFLSAGYLADGKYQTYEIPFSCFAQAVNSVLGDQIQFNLWTYNHNYRFKRNDDRVIRELNDYKQSKTSHNCRNGLYYGIEANRKLKEYLVNENSSDLPSVDLRYSRAYMEHKMMMYLAIKYLNETDAQNIKGDSNDLNCAYEIYQNAIIIHRLGMMANLSRKKQSITRISELIDVNERKEVLLLNKILRTE